MKQRAWKIYAYFIATAELVGIISGLLSRAGMMRYGETAVQPGFAPPGWIFPVVWTILYALMGIGAARVWLAEPSPERSRGINLFVAQLIVNFFWSLIFFNTQAYGFALIWLIILWVLVAWMIRTFAKTDRFAALIQIPYLLWLTFAAALNGAVWLLNR